MVDLEQLVIPNAAHFTYPIWPPGLIVDLIQSYGQMHDHDLLARPVWWKMTIWLDNLVFGPFYVVAIYAYVKGKNWIRMPSVIYASILLTNVIIILGEEYAGQYAAPNFPLVLLANVPWLVIPCHHYRTHVAFGAALYEAVPGGETGTVDQILTVAKPEGLETVGGRAVSRTAAAFRARYGPWALVAGASAGWVKSTRVNWRPLE